MAYLFANWKMYLNPSEAKTLLQDVAGMNTGDLMVAVFPNTIDIQPAVAALHGTPIAVGAQCVSPVENGAYTGATSAAIFAEAGCTHVLVGHSERRHIFGDSNEDVRKQLESALAAGLVPVLCIGETKEDLDEEKTMYRLKKQLLRALEGLSIPEGTLFVAYEPEWAISGSGSGIPCDPLKAEQVHHAIREELSALVSWQVPLLYGGSTTAENVVSYLSLECVDGVLVGRASTAADSFRSLIENMKSVS